MNATRIELLIYDSLLRVIRLPRTEIDREKSFDALGLDSISRVSLIAELGAKLQRRIDPEVALEFDTPRTLAEFLGNGACESGSATPATVTDPSLA